MAVDSTNKSHSAMGPECSFCTHRLRWHHHDGCSRCRCATFDEGVPNGIFGVVWHRRILRHAVEDLTIVVTLADRQRLGYRFRCSCGKEWRGKSRHKYYEDHGPA